MADNRFRLDSHSQPTLRSGHGCGTRAGMSTLLRRVKGLFRAAELDEAAAGAEVAERNRVERRYRERLNDRAPTPSGAESVTRKITSPLADRWTNMFVKGRALYFS